MRKVQQIMGMPISIDIPNIKDDSIFDIAFAEFQRIDKDFSNYKASSEISKYAGGLLKRADLSQELRQILVESKKAEKLTKGYFSVMAGGKLDANGYIKGWAISKVSALLKNNMITQFCISAGGDILAVGNKIWKIGLQDPFDRSQIITVVELRDSAIATSGNYERGKHIIDPLTGRPADYWTSVSVLGPDIIKADVLATACFAMGSKAINFIKPIKDYDLICVDKQKRIIRS